MSLVRGKRNPSSLAVVYGLPPETPDNVIQSIAGAMLANNAAHRIKKEFDANNPPPPPLAGAKQADRESQDVEPLSPSPHV
jgi:hypothetical protein